MNQLERHFSVKIHLFRPECTAVSSFSVTALVVSVVVVVGIIVGLIVYKKHTGRYLPVSLGR